MGELSTQCRRKMVLVGPPNAGKTSITQRYVNNRVPQEFDMTLGSAFHSKRVCRTDGTTVTLDIWDTAGQERFSSLIPLYYRGAEIALVVFDLTDFDSFFTIKFWLHELRRNASSVVTRVLIGNKCDEVTRRVVGRRQAEELAKSNGMAYFETSAKLNMNVTDIFLHCAQSVAISNGDQPTFNSSAIDKTIKLKRFRIAKRLRNWFPK